MAKSEQQVLPDFETRAESWDPSKDPHQNLELAADREWFHSQVRLFLEGEMQDGAKPVKRHRVATCRFLYALDVAMRHVGGWGWERFRSAGTPLRGAPLDVQVGCASEQAVVPRLGPTVSVTVDQHSVGWSAGLALSNKLKLFSQFIMDPSHRFARDIELALKASNMWYCILLMNIPFNVNYGPWEGSAFWREAQGAMARYVAEVGDIGCPLFQAFLPQIAVDKGSPQAEQDDVWQAQMWQRMVDGECFNRKGPKAALCRWASSLDCAAYLDPIWHERVVVLMYWGLSLGFVQRRSDGPLLAGNLAAGSSGAEAGSKDDAPSASGRGEDGLTMAQQQEKLKKLRGTAKNTLHCSLLILSDGDNQRCMRIILACCGPTRAWHGAQSCRLRSPSESHRWYAEQAGGDCLKHLVDTMAVLSDPSSLAYSFFGTLPLDVNMPPDNLGLLLDNEDSWFECAALLTLNILRMRLRSMLFYLEGPGLFAACLSETERPLTQALAFFERVSKGLAAARDMQSKSHWCVRSLKQTWLSWPLVEASLAMMEQSCFLEFPDEVKASASVAYAVGNMKVVEDFFNKARMVEQRGQSNCVVSQRRLWAKAIQRRVLSEVHSHTEIDKDKAFHTARAEVSKLSRELDSGLFHAGKVAPIVDLPKVSGRSSTPDWPTFTPTSQAALFAEVQVWLKALGDPSIWDGTSRLWLCHCMPLGFCVSMKGTDQWFLSLGHIEHVAVLGWRVRFEEVSGARFMIPVLPTGDLRDCYDWLVVVDAEQWLAQPIKWAAPCSKFHLHRFFGESSSGAASSASASTAAPRLRSIVDLPAGCIGGAICIGGQVPVLVECANRAFDGFNEALLTRLLKLYSIELPKTADLFDKIMAGVKRFASRGDDDILAALYSRMRPNRHTASHDDAFFQSDIVQACFDASDVKLVQEFSENSKKSELAASSFQEKVVAYHRSRKPPSERPKAQKSTRLPKPQPGLSQADAQAYLPPGARMSRDVPNSRWLVVFKPHGTISRSWPCWGEIPALAKVCKWAWEHYSRLEQRECPHSWIAEARWQNS